MGERPNRGQGSVAEQGLSGVLRMSARFIRVGASPRTSLVCHHPQRATTRLRATLLGGTALLSAAFCMMAMAAISSVATPALADGGAGGNVVGGAGAGGTDSLSGTG